MCDEYEFILASIGGLRLKRPKPFIIHPYQRRCVTWRDVIKTDVIGVLHGSTDHIPSFIKIEALELPNLNIKQKKVSSYPYKWLDNAHIFDKPSVQL